ncbi:MAG: amidophosphoribosyltransferase [Muribaculaceae bacterium]|nr:amidophosphoribosyltransferase [Muribaculaceae bacterium]
MEQIKHECGVALIRLRRPLQYYKEKYGTYSYGLDKLYLLMEKQHNRGQEAAGVGVVKFDVAPGNEYVFRERAMGSDAISVIFDRIHHEIASYVGGQASGTQYDEAPFSGNIYMGHLRYSTTGRSGISYVHPFLRRNNWRSRNLLLCGNFNMTNVEEIFQNIVAKGQHPRIYSDTVVILEQLGYYLDKENHRLYREFRDRLEDPQLSTTIEDNLELNNVLKAASPTWDGGFVICGATGSGDMFALRDRHGIRPAFYYYDDEIVVVASERPVIQTVMDVKRTDVRELQPGESLIVGKTGDISLSQVLEPADNRRCSFERIYFSRGSDADIYRERKALGRQLAPEILRMVDYDIDNTVFAFIPNTAEVAFMGLNEGLEAYLNSKKAERILAASREGKLDTERVAEIMNQKLRVEKIALKDIKLRTFIAEGQSRNDLAAHVYDVTYGCINNGVDTLVVIDDSIVRGTTLRQSILRMLDRLHPRRIIVVSSSPQVRFPDCYGIDMSRMAEFIAFKAAVELLKASGRSHIIDETYQRALENLKKPAEEQVNCVKAIYEPFSDSEISAQIAKMLTNANINASVDIVYQSIEGLHRAIPNHPGDWYFSGDYPTPGGVRLVNQAFVNYYEGNPDKR